MKQKVVTKLQWMLKEMGIFLGSMILLSTVAYGQQMSPQCSVLYDAYDAQLQTQLRQSVNQYINLNQQRMAELMSRILADAAANPPNQHTVLARSILNSWQSYRNLRFSNSSTYVQRTYAVMPLVEMVNRYVYERNLIVSDLRCPDGLRPRFPRISGGRRVYIPRYPDPIPFEGENGYHPNPNYFYSDFVMQYLHRVDCGVRQNADGYDTFVRPLSIRSFHNDANTMRGMSDAYPGYLRSDLIVELTRPIPIQFSLLNLQGQPTGVTRQVQSRSLGLSSYLILHETSPSQMSFRHRMNGEIVGEGSVSAISSGYYIENELLPSSCRRRSDGSGGSGTGGATASARSLQNALMSLLDTASSSSALGE